MQGGYRKISIDLFRDMFARLSLSFPKLNTTIVDSLTVRVRSKSNWERNELKAAILAGGQGIRLRPLTYVYPKVMLPLGGKPLLEYTIEYLKRYGLTTLFYAWHTYAAGSRSILATARTLESE